MQTLTLPLPRHFRATSAPLPRRFRAASAPLPRVIPASLVLCVEVAWKWRASGVELACKWGGVGARRTGRHQCLSSWSHQDQVTHSLTHSLYSLHSLTHCHAQEAQCPVRAKLSNTKSKATKVSAGQPARRRNMSHGIMAMMMPHCLWLRAFILVALYALGSKRV